MSSSLIIIVVELTPLGECSIHKDSVIDGNLVAVIDNGGSAIAFVLGDESVDSLIPVDGGTN